MIEETFAYGLVIGCSLFGILWGLVNALLVSNELTSHEAWLYILDSILALFPLFHLNHTYHLIHVSYPSDYRSERSI